MPKKLTQEQFLIRAKEVHGDVYDYSLVEYLGAWIKIKIVCKEHGVFEQNPADHTWKYGCPKCGIEKAKKLNSNDTKWFVEKSESIHSDRYDYSLVNYVNNETKVKIICEIHGIFEQIPSGHLRGKGCIKCADVAQLNNEEFIKRAKVIHDNEYDYSLSEYISAHVKVKIVCQTHGMFEQTPHSHTRGEGCPKCVSSISKVEVEWLDSLSIKEEYRHKTLFVDSKRFYVDAYDPLTNIIYEFYGDYWHGNPNVFNQNLIHPDIKKSFGEIYSRTLEREMRLKQAGFTIISIWEADYRR